MYIKTINVTNLIQLFLFITIVLLGVRPNAAKLDVDSITFNKLSNKDCQSYVNQSSKILGLTKFEIFEFDNVTSLNGKDYTIAIICKEKIFIIATSNENDFLPELLDTFIDINEQLKVQYGAKNEE